MIPLIILLLAAAAVYLGAIEAAFSALMRLSLRLSAERSDRPESPQRGPTQCRRPIPPTEDLPSGIFLTLAKERSGRHAFPLRGAH